MPGYEKAWTAVAAAVCAAGFVAAVDGWSLVLVLATSLVAGVFGVIVALPWLPLTTVWPSAVIKVMVVTAAITWVALGVAYMAGVAGLLIAIAVGLSCPELAPVYASLVHRKERFDEGVRSSDCAGAVAATPPARDPALESSIGALDEPSLDVPDLMTVEDLCHAWRSSYVALQRAVTAESRMRIVGMRALYLDELERQAGREVRAWLSSGARAASDPGRFVTGSQDGLRAR